MTRRACVGTTLCFAVMAVLAGCNRSGATHADASGIGGGGSGRAGAGGIGGTSGMGGTSGSGGTGASGGGASGTDGGTGGSDAATGGSGGGAGATGGSGGSGGATGGSGGSGGATGGSGGSGGATGGASGTGGGGTGGQGGQGGAGGSTGSCASAAAGTRVVRFRWTGSGSGSTATVVYEANTLPDTSRWHVSAGSTSIGFTPVFVDTALASGGLDLEGDVFTDIEISTVGLSAIDRATIAVYGRSYNTTTSGSFTWQTFDGTGASPTNLVSNVAPYSWYLADATTELAAGESGALIRLRAGPSSNALAVNRVEICFDAH